MMRVLWPAFLLVVALTAAAAQLDRQSRYQPHLAVLVPEAFRSFAADHLAVDAVRGADQERALRSARLLVSRRPVPAGHLSLLAAAQLQRDPQGRGLLTMEQAARRGWRDLAAQQAMLALALRAGDDAEAAARLAALLALGANEDELAALATDALARSGARQAFAEILASTPRWQSAVIVRLARLIPAPAFADTLARAGAAGARFDCMRLRRSLPASEGQIMPRACQ